MSLKRIQSEAVPSTGQGPLDGELKKGMSLPTPALGEDGRLQRMDKFGNPIISRATTLKMQALDNGKDSPVKKKDKDDKKTKHKLSFIDKIDKDSELTRLHHVQSYKKYNSMNTYDPYYVEEGEGSSHCCTIF